MTSEQLTKKILSEKATLTDEEWLKLYEEALHLSDLVEFKQTLAGNILGQMASFARINKEK